MVVWRGEPLHTMDISEKDATDMQNALERVGEIKFGKEKLYIDKTQR